MEDKLIIRGARENNLKNINIDIPKNKLVIMTGLSGSGKTSLAFDTIYAEGQRRYVESLSAYARQFLGNMEKPDVDSIEGLSPAIAIDQKTTSNNPRSTVGTVTEIYDYKLGTTTDMSTGKVVEGGLPKSNMIYYQLSDGAWFLVRPSGTEPKIKFYYGVKGLSASDSEDKLSELGDLVKGMFE